MSVRVKIHFLIRSLAIGGAQRPAMTLTMVGAAATGMPFGRQGERPARESRAFQASARRPSGSRTPVWVSPPSLTSRGRPRAAGPAR